MASHNSGKGLVVFVYTQKNSILEKKRNCFLTVWTTWLIGCVILLTSPFAVAEKIKSQEQTVMSSDLIEKIRPAHPRVILTAERIDEIKGNAASDSTFTWLKEYLFSMAEIICEKPEPERLLVGTKRKRLLNTSRDLVQRSSALGIAWHLSGEERFFTALIRDIDAVCSFEDWHPQHFLDTAEMTAAVAIAYDWLYNDLDPERRKNWREAIVNLGLLPSLDGDQWWDRGHNNWNQVCHGGLVMGALAIAEDEPDLAERIITRAKRNYVTGMAAYAPDGVYPEGPSYWTYGTSYTIMMAAALETAMGTTWDILEQPGFRESFIYRMHADGPTGRPVNYADAGEWYSAPSVMHMWMAKYDPSLAAFPHAALKRIMDADDAKKGVSQSTGPMRLLPLAALWYQPEKESTAKPPTAWYGGGAGKVELVCMRGAWNDPDTSFISLKGGDLENVSHGHLDAGSFIIEADGVRWAADIGTEPEIYDRNDTWDTFQDSPRWNFLRANNFSHNTLTIGEKLQRVKGRGKVNSFHTKPNHSHAVLDLSSVYTGQAENVRRGIALIDQRYILIQDEIESLTDEFNLRWLMVTKADIKISEDGCRAELARRGKRMTLLLAANVTGKFTSILMTPPTSQEEPNEEYTGLAIDFPHCSGAVRIAVWCVPGSAPERTIPEIIPLTEWGKHN